MSPIGGLALLGAAVPTALLAALLVGRRVSVGSARRSAVSRPPGSAASRTVAWLRRRLRARAAGSELGIICACVAARVRSGEEPAHAWASELVDRGWAAPADAAGGPRVGRNGSTGAATLPDTGQLPREARGARRQLCGRGRRPRRDPGRPSVRCSARGRARRGLRRDRGGGGGRCRSSPCPGRSGDDGAPARLAAARRAGPRELGWVPTRSRRPPTGVSVWSR